MKTASLFLVLVALTACAQLPPYQRNPFTTNTTSDLSLTIPLIDESYFTNDGAPKLVFLSEGYGKAELYRTRLYLSRWNSTTGLFNEHIRMDGASSGRLSLYLPFTLTNRGEVAAFYANNAGSWLIMKDANMVETIRFDGTTGAATVNSLILRAPQWSDVALTYSYSLLCPNAPSLVATTNGSPIQNLALDNGDIIYAQGHFPHNVAITNAAFPVFSIRPHVHWTPIGTLDATHSNVTWQIEYEIASTNGFWNLRGTNSITSGVTNNFTLRKTEFDPIQFAVPPGHDAGIRVRLTRPASASQEYGNDHIVLFDGIDMQVPVGNAELLGHSE